MTNSKTCYHVYPVIASRALADEIYSSGYRQWAIFPQDCNYEEWIDVESFHDVVADGLGTKIRNTYKTLSRHSGVYWDYVLGTGRYARGRVRIFSPQEVAKALGLQGPGPLIERPMSEAAGWSRRNLYAAMLKHHTEPGIRMTRKRLEEKSGIKVRSQKIYHSYLDLPRNTELSVGA